MTTHDPSVGLRYGRGWHARWSRVRYRAWRRWPRPAGPGARVHVPYQRKLAAIERALMAETPALSTRFALFNHLTRGERPVGVEQVSDPARPRLRRAQLAVLLALAAVAALCLTLTAQVRTSVRPCWAGAAAGAAASVPVRGLSCPAYATTKG
jgi:hypothetical protein